MTINCIGSDYLLRIDALVLAAGLSSRMPSNKMLLGLSGKTIIQHTVENILSSEIKSVKVIIGNQKEEIKSQLNNYQIDLVENDNYYLGMSTSIKAGINYLMQNEGMPDAVMVFLGDMPFIKPQTINQILVAYNKIKNDLVVPVYNGRRGHPVLFGKQCFSILLGLSGDSGARSFFSNPLLDKVKIKVDDPAIHIDIDCWDDYLTVKNMFEVTD